MNFSLQDKVALVTGGSRGIGKATALGFAAAGAHVAVASRKIEDLETVAAEISKSGRKSLSVAAHIGRMEDIDNLVKKVMEKFGRIDILVNNAGMSPSYNPLLDTDERLWNAIINLNLRGLFFLSLAVAKLMKEKGGGNIINVASNSGFQAEEGLGVYDISKAGVVMATKVMALEWAKYNIRVNAIAPGPVHTKMLDSALTFPEFAKQITERTPMKRIGEPEEMVGAMIYLASDASSFVTGVTIPVDGGTMLT
jgi:NAD(P)-dependent dehydrogenase (short-subunit alcohol dehydrogenase family)